MICQKEFTINVFDQIMHNMVWIEPTLGGNDRLPITAVGGYAADAWAFALIAGQTDRLIWMFHAFNTTADNYNLHFHMTVSGVISQLNDPNGHVSTLVRYGLVGPPALIPTLGTVIANDSTLGNAVAPYSRDVTGDYVLNAGLDMWFCLQWDPFRLVGTIDGTLTVVSSIV